MAFAVASHASNPQCAASVDLSQASLIEHKGADAAAMQASVLHVAYHRAIQATELITWLLQLTACQVCAQRRILHALHRGLTQDGTHRK